MSQLERATAARDWARICDDLLTASARRRAGGDDCERELRSNAEGVRRPRIEVRGIAVRGGAADVRVRTRAAGQAPVDERLKLRLERGEWRVEALAG